MSWGTHPPPPHPPTPTPTPHPKVVTPCRKCPTECTYSYRSHPPATDPPCACAPSAATSTTLWALGRGARVGICGGGREGGGREGGHARRGAGAGGGARPRRRRRRPPPRRLPRMRSCARRRSTRAPSRRRRARSRPRLRAARRPPPRRRPRRRCSENCLFRGGSDRPNVSRKPQFWQKFWPAVACRTTVNGLCAE